MCSFAGPRTLVLSDTTTHKPTCNNQSQEVQQQHRGCAALQAAVRRPSTRSSLLTSVSCRPSPRPVTAWRCVRCKDACPARHNAKQSSRQKWKQKHLPISSRLWPSQHTLAPSVPLPGSRQRASVRLHPQQCSCSCCRRRPGCGSAHIRKHHEPHKTSSSTTSNHTHTVPVDQLW